MSASDDDDLEGDDKLQGMRAVWLSMRDEEPSDKGLAALMAAAREKADELKDPAPTFWQKVLAAFRRPPVLALASVTLLLGGALVIANRGEKAVVDERATAPVSSNQSPAVVAEKAKDSAAGSASPVGSAASAPGFESTPVEEAPATADAVVTKPPRAKVPERKATRDAPKKTEPPPPPPPPPPEPKEESAPANTGEAMTDKPVEPTVTRGPQRRPASEPVVGGATASTDTKLVDSGSDEVEGARVLQLVKQCESAAARGDCAAVKALAARIRSQDAATYKARVVKNASIARCLE